MNILKPTIWLYIWVQAQESQKTIVNQTNLYYYSYLVVSLWGNHKDVILGSGSFRGGAELEALDLLMITDFTT